MNRHIVKVYRCNKKITIDASKVLRSASILFTLGPRLDQIRFDKHPTQYIQREQRNISEYVNNLRLTQGDVSLEWNLNMKSW